MKSLDEWRIVCAYSYSMVWRKKEDEAPKCAPFLKWVGGKRQLLSHLLPLVPPGVFAGRARYFEPFLGGGALFFAVSPPTAVCAAVLNDSNAQLINAYRVVRDHLPSLIARLRSFEKLHSEAFYYAQRATVPPGVVDQAARFIYLNKAGFNGLYRVNKTGGMNTPWGKHPSYTCDVEGLKACSKALQAAVLSSHDALVLDSTPCSTLYPKKGDFVYFDPPYVPLTATANFTAYTEGGFDDADQVALRDLALRLKKRGVVVVLSNSSADRVRQLYANGFKITEIDARRAVNSKGTARWAVKELIIT